MTKKYQKEKCQEILNRYPIDHTIKDERNFLLSVFRNHPDWEQKRGKGGRRIFIGKDQYNHRCFFIERVDNTIVDISFLKSINGKNRSQLETIKRACRTAIVPEIQNFKSKNVIFGKTKCVISNEILTKDNINIDHYDLKFSEMFELWMKKQDIKRLLINIESKDQTDCFINNEILNDFINFHNENCKLRAVTKHVNQTILK